ncbi:MAG: hypothetical protein JW804_04420 [Sedimentisphaerales bacterium]|nr:hypothetical protein [Sedimentisphaerales bacterium]
MAKYDTAKTRPVKNKKYFLVRYGRMNSLSLFEHNESSVPKVRTRVVVKTEKGLELGYLVGQLTSYKAGQLKLNPDQINGYYRNSEIEFICEPAGSFVRFATPADISEERHLRKIVKEEIETCRRLIAELELDMKIIDAEHILGGERIIFYFRAEGRIDFRELVKKLAHEYQTRIEMRQIGSRDEAKILGDVESCGQQCCCQRFLKALKPVNMRMAKMQKATLDPSKISGYCGRLKCCLRYEDKMYTELKKRLPKKNIEVNTPNGIGKVIDTQILTQLVVVEYASGSREAIAVEEIEVVSPLQKRQQANQQQPRQGIEPQPDIDEEQLQLKKEDQIQ